MAIPFTKIGYEKIIEDLKIAEAKRPQAVETLSRARSMGDLSENGFYKGAKSELVDLDRKIRHLRNLVQYGQAIDKPLSTNSVQFGHTVTLKRIA